MVIISNTRIKKSPKMIIIAPMIHFFAFKSTSVCVAESQKPVSHFHFASGQLFHVSPQSSRQGGDMYLLS